MQLRVWIRVLHLFSVMVLGLFGFPMNAGDEANLKGIVGAYDLCIYVHVLALCALFFATVCLIWLGTWRVQCATRRAMS